MTKDKGILPKYYYAVIYNYNGLGEISINIPDVKGCWTSGTTIDDSLISTIDALAGCLSASKVYPKASDYEDMLFKYDPSESGENVLIMPIFVDKELIEEYDKSRIELLQRKCDQLEATVTAINEVVPDILNEAIQSFKEAGGEAAVLRLFKMPIVNEVGAMKQFRKMVDIEFFRDGVANNTIQITPEVESDICTRISCNEHEYWLYGKTKYNQPFL